MADARLNQILDAIEVRLAIPDGVSAWVGPTGLTDTWHINTSIAGRVVRGRTPSTALPKEGELPQWQIVPVFPFESEPGTTQQAFMRNATVMIAGYCVAASSTFESRTDAAINMLSDGMTALELDLGLGGLLYGPMLIARGMASAGELQPSQSGSKICSCWFEIDFTWKSVIASGI